MDGSSKEIAVHYLARCFRPCHAVRVRAGNQGVTARPAQQKRKMRGFEDLDNAWSCQSSLAKNRHVDGSQTQSNLLATHSGSPWNSLSKDSWTLQWSKRETRLCKRETRLCQPTMWKAENQKSETNSLLLLVKGKVQELKKESGGIWAIYE